MDLHFSYVNEARTNENVVPHRRKSYVLNSKWYHCARERAQPDTRTHAQHKAVVIKRVFKTANRTNIGAGK